MKSAILLTLLIFSLVSSAQDKIYFKSGKVEEVKITEIGPTEVKYIRLNQDRELTIGTLRDDLLRIEFENGDLLVMVNDLQNPDLYADQRSKALKMDFFTPLLGYSSFSYENSIRPGMSMEVGVSFIGLGKNVGNRNPVGMVGRYGVRFLKLPDFKNGGTLRYHHILQGLYVKPELVFASFKDHYEEWNESSRDFDRVSGNVSYGLFSINAGEQWVFQDILLVDIYVGGGYGFVSVPKNYESENYFGYFGKSESASLWATAGFRIGILLK